MKLIKRSLLKERRNLLRALSSVVGACHSRDMEHGDSVSQSRVNLEPLEPRLMLSGDLLITEFVANNSGVVLDEDGFASDWIEIYNSGRGVMSLQGWSLTDDPDDLDKWVFPDVKLNGGDYLVVFASGKDRITADTPLHTNFDLPEQTGYLALVKPDGSSITTEYVDYPEQYPNAGYGLTKSEPFVLLEEFSSGRTIVPMDDSMGFDWTSKDFDDSGWIGGSTGIGYEASSGYENLIVTDVQDEMYQINSSVYTRIPFEVDDVVSVQKLRLRMKADDGFVAYINGEEVARRLAPDDLNWSSSAIFSYDDNLATIFEDFDISPYRMILNQGQNILAIHGLNENPSSSDMLILPELDAQSISAEVDLMRYFAQATPGEENGNGAREYNPGQRITDGLVALYDLQEGQGNVVHDVSGVGAALDLQIVNTANVSWIEGGLSINDPTVIWSTQPGTKITTAVTASHEITVEAWINSETRFQDGPARIVTLSSNASFRNFTLGQDGSRYDFRLRTSQTGDNGSDVTLTTNRRRVDPGDLQHIVYTFEQGQARLYIDGELDETASIPGDITNWDSSFRFALGNELSQNRPWLGDIHLVAVYSQALTPEQIIQNYELGADFVVDVTSPTIVNASVTFEDGADRLELEFDEDVSASFNTQDILVMNTSHALDILPEDMAISYNPQTHQATITFPGYGGTLPSGEYTFRVGGTGVLDLAGNQLDGDADGEPGGVFEIPSVKARAGDATFNDVVDLEDLALLADHFGMGNAAWGDGDFNGDGTVNLTDLSILAGVYGTDYREEVGAGGGVAEAGDEPAANERQQAIIEAMLDGGNGKSEPQIVESDWGHIQNILIQDDDESVTLM